MQYGESMSVLPGKGSESAPMKFPIVSRKQQHSPEAGRENVTHRRGEKKTCQLRRQVKVPERGRAWARTLMVIWAFTRKLYSLWLILGIVLSSFISLGNHVSKSMAKTLTSRLMFALILIWQSRCQPHGRHREIRGYSHPPMGILQIRFLPCSVLFY